MLSNKVINLEKEVLLSTYARPDFVFTQGQGVYLLDSDGKCYLDFVAGIAVNAFGHCDEQLINAMQIQAKKLWHCSNLYHSEPQVKVAKLLVDHSFADKVFFCNSGTEAIEGALKFARKWARAVKDQDSYQIIAFNRSFHGRTMGAISATGQANLWNGFAPMLPGFQFADFNDLDSVRSLITKKTCAILVEPIQGEGGIHVADAGFLPGLRNLCDQNRLLLILDEIQCGLGRTGTLFAHDQYGIKPDIMTLAKPLAGGLPMGAILMTDLVAQHIKIGDHGSTFGGGPLVASVAECVLNRLIEPTFLDQVKETGQYLMDELLALRSSFPEIQSIRGLCLMIGIDMKFAAKDVITACYENGLLIYKAGQNTVRLLPPLIVDKDHIDEAIEKFISALYSVREKNG